MASFINKKNFDKNVLESNVPVFVIFWSKRSPLAKEADEKLAALSKTHKEMKVYKVNIDKEWDLFDRFRLPGQKNVSTIIAFKDGRQRGEGEAYKQSLEEIWALQNGEPPVANTPPAPMEEKPAPLRKPETLVIVTADNFGEQVLQSGKKILLYCWLESMAPSDPKYHAGILGLLASIEAEDTSGDYKLCIMDIENPAESSLARSHNIFGVGVSAFYGGQMIDGIGNHADVQKVKRIFTDYVAGPTAYLQGRSPALPDYNEEYFYMRPVPNIYPVLMLLGLQDSIFLSDKPIEHTHLRFVFDLTLTPNNAPKLGEAHGIGQNFVVSARVKEAFEELGLVKTQFVPASIRDEQNNIHEGYYAMHMHNSINCADLKYSDWTPSSANPNEVQSIHKLVLDNAVLDTVPLEGRLAIMIGETHNCGIYHRSVVDHILKLRPQGIRFYPITASGREAFIDEALDIILAD